MTTPVISGVTGTVSTGQVLTVSGSTMLDELKTSWMSMFQSGTAYSFQGTDPNSDGYWVAQSGATYSTSSPLHSTKVYRNQITGAHSTNAEMYNYFDIQSLGNELYWRTYVRWISSGTVSKWPNNHIKMVGVYGTPSNGWLIQPGATDGSTLPDDLIVFYDGANHIVTPANFLQNNRWYCIEAHFRTGTSRLIECWVDGVNMGSWVPSNNYTMQYFEFGLINLMATGSDFNLIHDHDALVVSTARVNPATIVEIGNNATYASATKVRQALRTMADASVSITCDLTGLGAGPYWLWVTNNRNERSAAYALSGQQVIAPVAAFTANVTSGQSPLSVTFTDQSTNSPDAWSWTFGANASPLTATTQNPSTTYTSGGPKTVVLTASNAGGSDDETKTNYIAARYLKPTNFQAN